MKVMVVDDEKIALEKITDQITSLDFVSSVYAFDNPEHAFSSLSDICPDVAILDIEMFAMNGIELAKRCKLCCPHMGIIFLTGYSNYAVKAFKVRANGYLLKPASTDEIKEELLAIGVGRDMIRTCEKSDAHIRIQTFGNFEVFVDGKPIDFERIKAKELLAYLVSRKGAYVNGDELLAILYEDKPITPSSKSQLRNLTASLTKSLKAVDAEHLLLKKRNQLAIDANSCYCDYFEFLKGDATAINSFMGEFMSNYEWAEFITGYLEQNTTPKSI